MLEQDGLTLTTESGTIVNPMEIEDIKEVYQCRIASEPYAGLKDKRGNNTQEVMLVFRQEKRVRCRIKRNPSHF